MNLVITQIGGCSDDTGNSLNPALTWMLCKDGSYKYDRNRKSKLLGIETCPLPSFCQ